MTEKKTKKQKQLSIPSELVYNMGGWLLLLRGDMIHGEDLLGMYVQSHSKIDVDAPLKIWPFPDETVVELNPNCVVAVRRGA